MVRSSSPPQPRPPARVGANSLLVVPNSTPNDPRLLPIGLLMFDDGADAEPMTPSESILSSLQNECVPSEKGDRNRSQLELVEAELELGPALDDMEG